MRRGRNAWLAQSFTTAVLALIALPSTTALGQEAGFLSRLFGSARNTSNPVPASRATDAPRRGPVEFDARPLAPLPDFAPASVAPEISSGPGTDRAGSPRILPQPRQSRAATDSDPLVTRITLGRSDDGRTFGMFLQVFADGTVIDSEGVRSLGREGIRPVAEALQAGELFRQRGHCGGPPTDFVEQVHVTVYDKSMGRLRANAFSFSGNPQGCDPSVIRLQNALETVQVRTSSTQGTAAPAPFEPLGPVTPLPPPLRLNEDGPEGERRPDRE